MAQHSDNKPEEVNGTILGHAQGLHFHVALDDGQELIAVLKKTTLQRSGDLFGDLAGWRVKVAFRPADKPLAIVELLPPTPLST